MDFNSNSKIKLFSRAFITDLNLLSKNILLNFKREDLEFKGLVTNDLLEKFIFKNRQDHDEFLNNRVKSCLNSYGLQSDSFILESNFKTVKYSPDPRIDDINDPLLIDNNTKPIKQKIFTYIYSNIKKDIIPKHSDGHEFSIAQKPFDEILNISNLTDAFNFIKLYGFDYPICNYTSKNFKVFTIALSSSSIQDEALLKKIGWDSLKRLVQNVYRRDRPCVYENLPEYASQSENKFQYRIEFLVNDLKLGTYYKYQKGSPLTWMPIWQIVLNSKGGERVSEKIICLLRDAHSVRHKNFLTLEKVFVNRFTEITSHIAFSYKKYWRESVLGHVIDYFKRRQNATYYMRNRTPNNLEQQSDNDCLNELYDLMFRNEEKALEYLINENKRLFYLAQSIKFDAFIEDERKKYNIVVLYYNQEYIAQNHDSWLLALRLINSCIDAYENDRRFKETQEKKLIGLIVDTMLHDELSDSRYSNRFLNIEYLFDSHINAQTVRAIDSELNQVKTFDYTNTGRMALNDLADKQYKNNDEIKLVLKDNNFSNLNYYSFGDLEWAYNIVDLNLAGNMIKKLDENALYRMNNVLRRIDLSNNLLECVKHQDFIGMVRLEHLNLSNNKIKTIESGSFSTLFRLSELFLNNNCIREIPDELFDQRGRDYELDELNLSFNQITYLNNEIFENLRNLRVLALNNNNLIDLDDAIFDGLSGLEVLFLNANKLTYIDDTIFSNLVDLRILFLHDNSFGDEFSDDVFYAFLDNQKFDGFLLITSNEQVPENQKVFKQYSKFLSLHNNFSEYNF